MLQFLALNGWDLEPDHDRVRDRALDLKTGRLGRPGPEGERTGDVEVQVLVEENQRLDREQDRLRRLLREHGIEPGGGTARSA